MTEVRMDGEELTRVVARDLLWHAEFAENKKDRKALLRSAMYYMTFKEAAQYLGSKEVAEEYWN